MAIGAAGLWVIGARTMVRPPWRWLIVGGVAMAAYQVAFFTAVARAGVALGTVVAIGIAPVVGGCIAWVARQEVPEPRWWVATAMAISGVALISGRPETVDMAGVAFAVIAGTAYATTTLASKYLLDTMGPTAAMAALFGLAALMLLPFLPGADLGWLEATSGLAAVLWLGLAATTLAYVAFAHGLRDATVGQATTIALAEPATATVLGVVLLAERQPWPAWVGVALVAAGLVTTSRRQRAVIG